MAELKYLCLAHRNHSDQAHQGMAAVKKKLAHPLQRMARTKKYLQELTTTLPPHLQVCSVNETSTQTLARWFFGTRVPDLSSVLGFHITSIFLAPTPHLLIYWPIV